MWQDEGVVEHLSRDDCWRLLRGKSLGRIALGVGRGIDIIPVSYHCDGTSIVFRTAPGAAVVDTEGTARIAFEADGFDDMTAWSVVVKGTARRADAAAGTDDPDAFPLRSRATLTHDYVRLSPTAVTGRRFERLLEPERY